APRDWFWRIKKYSRVDQFGTARHAGFSQSSHVIGPAPEKTKCGERCVFRGKNACVPRLVLAGVAPMKHHILVVDDEKSVRESQALLFQASGYDVSMAENGLDALLQLKTPNLPDLVISDLNMPNMSGFELLSVLRRRFPQISVIASSGAYLSGEDVPGGVIADAFHSKNGSGPVELLKTDARLLATSAERNTEHHSQSAPVWIPRNGKDSNGVPFIVVTCTNCLRSFPLSVLHENLHEVQEA